MNFLKQHAIAPVLAAFLLVLLLLPWLHPWAGGPTPAVQPWLIAMACSVMLWALRAHLTVRMVAMTWLAAALASSVMGLLQYFGYAEHLHGWVRTTGLGEAFANLRQRNQFASLTSIGLAALIWLEANPSQAENNPAQPQPLPASGLSSNSLHWAWVMGAVIVLAMGNATSSSRTGALQWCLLFMLTLGWSRRGQWRGVLIGAMALVAYALCTLALPIILEQGMGVARGGLLARFAENSGCGSRTVLWSNVLHLIAQKPWAGWGWGELDYAHFITLYPGQRFCDILDNAHNLPLHLAVELGLPIALAVLGGLAWWVLRQRPWAEQAPARQLAWSVLVVVGVHSLLEYPLWYGPFQLACGLSVWLLWSSCPAAVAGFFGKPGQLRMQQGVHWAVAMLCLAMIAFAAWDYTRVAQLYLEPADRMAAYRENTLQQVRGSRLFQEQVQFAELTTSAVTRANAEAKLQQAQALLHYSPEPRIIEVVIDSAVMLSQDDLAKHYLLRYRAAFPAEHAAWIVQSSRFKNP
jgi:hypothetical protein